MRTLIVIIATVLSLAACVDSSSAPTSNLGHHDGETRGGDNAGAGGSDVGAGDQK